jgi:hypothetical protein
MWFAQRSKWGLIKSSRSSQIALLLLETLPWWLDSTGPLRILRRMIFKRKVFRWGTREHACMTPRHFSSCQATLISILFSSFIKKKFREVTGFVFLHTITYLDTLSSMFPNLTIIRGQRLFSNYALVLYDTQLSEVNAKILS